MSTSRCLHHRLRAIRLIFFALLVACLSCASACKSGSSDAKPSDEGQGADKTGGALLADKLKVEGKETFSIKPKDDGAKLVDDGDAERARYKTEKNGFRIKGPDDAPIAEIEIKGDEIRVVRSGATLYELKRYPDGDWKLKDASKAELFHVKKKDGAAFEVENAKGERLAKVDVNALGKTKVKDASGAELWVAKDKVGAPALACLAFVGVDLSIRVGLLLAVGRM